MLLADPMDGQNSSFADVRSRVLKEVGYFLVQIPSKVRRDEVGKTIQSDSDIRRARSHILRERIDGYGTRRGQLTFLSKLVVSIRTSVSSSKD